MGNEPLWRRKCNRLGIGGTPLRQPDEYDSRHSELVACDGCYDLTPWRPVNKIYCEPCRKARAHKRRIKEDIRAEQRYRQGICTECGKHPRLKPNYWCERCLMMERARQARRRLKVRFNGI